MSVAKVSQILNSNAKDIVIDRATGATTIATSIAPNGKKWALREIRVHLSAAGGAGNLTATIDSATDAVYDTIVLTQDMSSVTNLEWQPDFPMIFDEGDELDIDWANGSSRTYGLEVIYSEYKG